MDPTQTTPNWLPQHESILKSWAVRASYRYLHSQAEQIYNKKNRNFTIPVISYLYDHRDGEFQLLDASLATLRAFGDRKFESYCRARHDHRKLSASWRTLEATPVVGFGVGAPRNTVELSLPVEERHESGEEFIQKCRAELDKLLEQSPNLDTTIVQSLHEGSRSPCSPSQRFSISARSKSSTRARRRRWRNKSWKKPWNLRKSSEKRRRRRGSTFPT